MSISRRKNEHILICLRENVEFSQKTTGFEEYDFLHCALPETDFEAIDTRIPFLNRSLSFPFMISALTGGSRETQAINRIVGELCNEFDIAVGLGSQRAMLEDESTIPSYTVVRKAAPRGIIIGNIGAAQIRGDDAPDLVKKLTEAVEADAMAIHINPLQEILQPEGDRSFSGVLDALERLRAALDIPLIVKEVGCGISADLVKRLTDCGIDYIDIAGAGGTSWAAVEEMRGRVYTTSAFREWGIPTAACITAGSAVPNARIIASGGIRSGIDLAKAIALGAELGGAALPVLRAIADDNAEAGRRLIETWKHEFTSVLFLTGAGNISDFRKNSRMVNTLTGTPHEPTY